MLLNLKQRRDASNLRNLIKPFMHLSLGYKISILD